MFSAFCSTSAPLRQQEIRGRCKSPSGRCSFASFGPVEHPWGKSGSGVLCQCVIMFGSLLDCSTHFGRNSQHRSAAELEQITPVDAQSPIPPAIVAILVQAVFVSRALSVGGLYKLDREVRELSSCPTTSCSQTVLCAPCGFRSWCAR